MIATSFSAMLTIVSSICLLLNISFCFELHLQHEQHVLGTRKQQLTLDLLASATPFLLPPSLMAHFKVSPLNLHFLPTMLGTQGILLILISTLC